MTMLETTQYWLTRFWFQRAMGLIYLIGFLIAVNQYLPLLGNDGLQPVQLYLRRVSFWKAPSLLWINCSDRFILVISWFGVLLSILALSGLSDSFGMVVSVVCWSLLWLFYLSLVNVGQTFYGFGWEMILLESGFLTIFLGSSNVRVPMFVLWLLKWVLFRIMFGAGMIKLRADPCWRDLTCMFYHYETQPLPNPLSWYFHHQPKWMHKAAVLFNHFVELPIPWLYFAPSPLREIAGGFTILFQIILIFSGNLSWLNYITIALCIPCFDDRFFSHLSPHISLLKAPLDLPPLSMLHVAFVFALTLVVLLLSIRPARNLFSRRQLMNASFDPLHLVNTYGAFGSVTRERMEIVIEGTDAIFPDASASWREYEFKAKPGAINRRPPLVSPYHFKIDWQMWFAAMSSAMMHPWIFPFVEKLLAGDAKTLGLLGRNPFPDAPPKFIRARLYRYRFTARDDPSGNFWQRTFVREYLPPLSLDDFRSGKI